MGDGFGAAGGSPGGPFSSLVSAQHPSYKKAYNKFKKNALIKMYFKSPKQKGTTEFAKKNEDFDDYAKADALFDKGTEEGFSEELFTNLLNAIGRDISKSKNTNDKMELLNIISDASKDWDNFDYAKAEKILLRFRFPRSMIKELLPHNAKETLADIKRMKAKAHKLPDKSLKINEALQLVKFRYTNNKHDPVPQVKVLDTEYKGQPHQSTYNQRRDVLGWNLNYYENKQEAEKTIDEIDDFARILGTSKKDKYERIKRFFPEQASLLRRYIKTNCKGVKVKEEGLWRNTDWDRIKDLTD